MCPSRFDRSAHRLERLNHLLLVVLSALVAAALYRFVTLLLDGLPWPVVPPWA